MSPETEHQTSVRFQHAWSEWRAECACGWTGSYLESRSQAEREAESHVPDNNEQRTE